jgi:hypothetical protein
LVSPSGFGHSIGVDDDAIARLQHEIGFVEGGVREHAEQRP